MAKKKVVKKALSAENLANALWDTIDDLKNERVDHKVATAIARQANQICKIQKLQLQYEKAGSRKRKVLV